MGAGLPLRVESRAAALPGATRSAAPTPFFDSEGPPPAVGQLLLAIDPGALGGAEAFADRISALVEAIEGDDPARLPGSRRIALRRQAAEEGVVLDATLLAQVRAIADGDH